MRKENRVLLGVGPRPCLGDGSLIWPQHQEKRIAVSIYFHLQSKLCEIQAKWGEGRGAWGAGRALRSALRSGNLGRGSRRGRGEGLLRTGSPPPPAHRVVPAGWTPGALGTQGLPGSAPRAPEGRASTLFSVLVTAQPLEPPPESPPTIQQGSARREPCPGRAFQVHVSPERATGTKASHGTFRFTHGRPG